MSSPVVPAILSTRTMRDLGHALLDRARAAEAADHVGRLTLDENGVVRLTEILVAGNRPTVGFWRRYGRKVPA